MPAPRRCQGAARSRAGWAERLPRCRAGTTPPLGEQRRTMDVKSAGRTAVRAKNSPAPGVPTTSQQSMDDRTVDGDRDAGKSMSQSGGNFVVPLPQRSPASPAEDEDLNFPKDRPSPSWWPALSTSTDLARHPAGLRRASQRIYRQPALPSPKLSVSEARYIDQARAAEQRSTSMRLRLCASQPPLVPPVPD